MIKLAMLGASGLVSLSLLGFFQPPPPPRGDFGEPPPKAKKAEPKKKKGEPKEKKGEGPGPIGDLQKAYDVLRRVRAETGGGGRSEERLRDWTDRAVKFYRQGLDAHRAGDFDMAHEYGAMAHELARTVDHARNAARFERDDPDLPPPPDGFGPADSGERTSRDLFRAYERIREVQYTSRGEGVRFYVDAAKDLYNAARKDVGAGRVDRGGELARAADAMTHVAEHMTHADDLKAGAFTRPVPKEARKGFGPKGERPRDFGPKGEPPPADFGPKGERPHDFGPKGEPPPADFGSAPLPPEIP